MHPKIAAALADHRIDWRTRRAIEDAARDAATVGARAVRSAVMARHEHSARIEAEAAASYARIALDMIEEA